MIFKRIFVVNVINCVKKRDYLMNRTLLNHIDKSQMQITALNDHKSDFRFWQTQSYEFRLAALEQIRAEYNTWKYGTEQGFQRVYCVTQQTQG